MPYHIRKLKSKWCVYKGHKASPGKQIHCHPTRAKAIAHMAALYVHVEDASSKKDLQDALDGALLGYAIVKDDGTHLDHWLAVSASTMWDKHDEMFTKDAMDYDIARALRVDRFPELRLWHIRAFKLGQCTRMDRIDDYAVEQGYWFDTPFAQAMKDIILCNKGKWKVSRGFYSVQATGLCTSCGAGLMVVPINYMLGVSCKDCGIYFACPKMLKQLTHLKTVTFDLSITDVPVTPKTAVTAFSIQA